MEMEEWMCVGRKEGGGRGIRKRVDRENCGWYVKQINEWKKYHHPMSLLKKASK